MFNSESEEFINSTTPSVYEFSSTFDDFINHERYWIRILRFHLKSAFEKIPFYPIQLKICFTVSVSFLNVKTFLWNMLMWFLKKCKRGRVVSFLIQFIRIWFKCNYYLSVTISLFFPDRPLLQNLFKVPTFTAFFFSLFSTFIKQSTNTAHNVFSYLNKRICQFYSFENKNEFKHKSVSKQFELECTLNLCQGKGYNISSISYSFFSTYDCNCLRGIKFL